jgi:hypothetical protein
VSVPLIVGMALVAFGAFVLIRMPLRPGGTIKTKWFEVSSVGAGLPLIVLGVAAIIISRVDPFIGDNNDGETSGTATAVERYFDEVDGARGRVWFEDHAMYFDAKLEGRRLVNLAQGFHAERFKVRATWVEGAMEYGVGLICRYEVAGRYYVLAIASDGFFNFVEYADGKARSLVDGFQPAGTIDSRANTLEARCEGDDPVRLTLLVNGAPVRSPVEDVTTPIERGSIGIRVGTREPPVKVKFENFQLLD